MDMETEQKRIPLSFSLTPLMINHFYGKSCQPKVKLVNYIQQTQLKYSHLVWSGIPTFLSSACFCSCVYRYVSNFGWWCRWLTLFEGPPYSTKTYKLEELIFLKWPEMCLCVRITLLLYVSCLSLKMAGIGTTHPLLISFQMTQHENGSCKVFTANLTIICSPSLQI